MSGPRNSLRRAPGRYRYTVMAWVDHFESWRQRAGAARRSGGHSDRARGGRCARRRGPPRAHRPAMPRASPHWAAQLRQSAADSGIADAGTLKALALDPARATHRGPLRRPQPAPTPPCSRSDGGPQAGGLQQLVRAVSTLGCAGAGAPRHTSGTSRLGCRISPRWASTCCTFRPFSRSDASTARDATTRLLRSPTTSAAPGRSDPKRAATRQCCRSLGRSTNSDTWSRRRANSGIEIALDIAFQCAPDHPYVADHPQWFKHRPDGSVQYAENPPKKYQDIYPFDFETDDWRALWDELKSVVEFWIEQGVRIFRVDNPHTKPFAFWEWLISEIQRRRPERDLPRRGVHPAEGHAPAGKARIHSVIHLLHLAQYQAGAHRLLH